MKAVNIETPRLQIRGFVIDDALALSRILSDVRLMRFSLGATANENAMQLIKNQLTKMTMKKDNTDVLTLWGNYKRFINHALFIRARTNGAKQRKPATTDFKDHDEQA